MGLPDAAYRALRRKIESVLSSGRRRVEEEKARTYWKIGKLIDDYFLQNKIRAGYGNQTIQHLSEDLKVDERTLYRALDFARATPILTARSKLGWTQLRLLAAVEDPGLRENLASEAAQKKWSSRELEAAISRHKKKKGGQLAGAKSASEKSGAVRFITRRGRPGIFGIREVSGRMVQDFGFALYRDLTPAEAARFKAGDFVSVGASGELEKISGASKNDLYTYRARLERVIDADTLWVHILLEPGRWFRKKLRLRALDAPELAAKAGKAAKQFVEEKLKGITEILITTAKPDKYDRYLSDVWIGDTNLNLELLKAGHARPTAVYSSADWEK